MYTLLLILHLVSAIALIAIVLLQAGRGGGLSGAFGSGMGSETLFGARTGDVLTRGTAVVATVFILTSLGLAFLSARTGSSVTEKIRQEERQKQLQEEQMKQLQELLKTKAAEEAPKATAPVPGATPAPAPEATKPLQPTESQ